ncbi:MAG: Hpt domain-containing protein [Pseudomonadota bacterium]
MDTLNRESESTDLSALAWVNEELRRSLDTAHKSLRRFLKEAEVASGSDLDAVDPSVLRTARTQVHQGVGALEMVGLSPAAALLRASENALLQCISKPAKLNSKSVDTIERASFALLDYLARLLANKPVSPLSFFPQYQAVQELAVADRIHPADLWAIEWSWHDLPVDPQATPRQADTATRSALETHMLAIMRSPSPTSFVRMSELCAGLAAGAPGTKAATLWQLASAVFEAQSRGLLRADVFSKRLASRLLSQLRILEGGGSEVSERLVQDLLFFCVHAAEAPAGGPPTTRLSAARAAWGLKATPVDYNNATLGRFDPALLLQAGKRVVSAKEAWSAVAGGELHRLAGLGEQFALVADSLRKLFPQGDALAVEMQAAATQSIQSEAMPEAGLAMEVATALLYIEAALEDGDVDGPEQGDRVRRLAERIAAVRSGQPQAALEGWMEDLYRRVSDRQTMGSVVQELRASLSEVEKLVDQFFRQTADSASLMTVPGLLSSMRGVLSVLGLDQASAAVVRMRDDVDALVASATAADPAAASAPLFERLAGNLGALDFLIGMLSVQPQMAKSLFVFDADKGTLTPVMGREAAGLGPTRHDTETLPTVEPRLIEQAQLLAMSAARGDVPLEDLNRGLEMLSQEARAAEQTNLMATVSQAKAALEQAVDAAGVADAREQLSEALVEFVNSSTDPIGLDAPLERKFEFTPIPTNEDLSEDVEMREIFLEEAKEVIHDAGQAIDQLQHAVDDINLLTTIRRAFHTLKGSSRMVGMNVFGEAAWVCEQLYNGRLGDQKPADAPLVNFTRWALQYFTEWVADIENRTDGHRTHEPVANAARALEAAPAPALDPIAADAEAEATTSSEASTDFLKIDDRLSLDFSQPENGAQASPVVGESGGDAGQEQPAAMFPEVRDAQPAVELSTPDFALDLGGSPDAEPLAFDAQTQTQAPPAVEAVSMPEVAHGPELTSEPEPEPELNAAAGEEPVAEEEQVKVIGHLRIGIPLFNIYLNEADELSRRLSTALAEWSHEIEHPIGDDPIALAHSLAGSSATVGFMGLSSLARALEHAQTRSQAAGSGTSEEAQLFPDVAEEIRNLLHQFAAGFLKEPSPALFERLAAHEMTAGRRLEQLSARADLDDASANGVLSTGGEDGLQPPVAAERDRFAHEVPEVDTLGDAEPIDLAFAQTDLDILSDSETDADAVANPGTETIPGVHLDFNIESPVDEATAINLDLDLGLPAATDASDASDEAPDDFRPAGHETAFSALDAPVLVELPPMVQFDYDAPKATTALRPAELEEDDAADDEDDIDAIDAVDAELFPIFEEEGQELLPTLATQIRDWAREPGVAGHGGACMRTLHTLKGGARLAGAMRLGEMAHRLESRIERMLGQSQIEVDDIEVLNARSDALTHAFDQLRNRDQAAYDQNVAQVEQAVRNEAPLPELPPALDADASLATAASGEAAAEQQPHAVSVPATTARTVNDIDWTHLAGDATPTVQATGKATAAGHSAVRVRAPLLDRLVNQAGEVSITRSRIASEVGQLRGSLSDLTDNLERLRLQLRDIELQGETQMASRIEAAKAADQSFDPLEFDRFTRFQELTRMMAESVNDVATVQRTLNRTLDSADDELAAQGRLTRELQDDLLRTRMVEFDSLSDRLYRVVRQASKETGKQVRLDIVGASIEVDRGVLDRMTGAFEHLLRNSVTHGIEMPDHRRAAEKDPIGTIVVTVTQEGNEVSVAFRDDGAGLDLNRIRQKGEAMGLIDLQQPHSDAELANLIFTPGFSTADKVTELAGRGIGMDVVRSEVNAIGGRIETATAVGQGTSFKLQLPLTTAVTQIVMMRVGETTVAVPSTMVELIRRVPVNEVDQAYAAGAYTFADRTLPFFWLGALLQLSPRSAETLGRNRYVAIIKSAQQRIAVHMDDVLGNQEAVVKNLGPQLARLPGLAGMTLLASGVVALIYNPVALATLYGDVARDATQAALFKPGSDEPAKPVAPEVTARVAPLVLVVDDSLTVRRVTQRLLVREGYRVVLAKDGLDALEKLAEEKPQIVLSDIEMPRMDGFDLVRNIRGDARLRDLPVIMITSRIAQKHRDYAAELGVDHYLGKPYSEEDLLALIGRYTSAHAIA